MSASRAGRNAEPPVSSDLLHRDQAVDDLAALDQELVHLLVNAVDFLPQIGKRLVGAARRFWHGLTQ